MRTGRPTHGILEGSPQTSPDVRFKDSGVRVDVWYPGAKNGAVGTAEVVHHIGRRDSSGIAEAASAFNDFRERSQLGPFLASLGLAARTISFNARESTELKLPRGENTITQLRFPSVAAIAAAIYRLNSQLPEGYGLRHVAPFAADVREDPTGLEVDRYLVDKATHLLPTRGLPALRAPFRDLPGILSQPLSVQEAHLHHIVQRMTVDRSSPDNVDGRLGRLLLPVSATEIAAALSVSGIAADVVNGDSARLGSNLRLLLNERHPEWEPPEAMGLEAHQAHAGQVGATFAALSSLGSPAQAV